jgi:hypothetical protein
LQQGQHPRRDPKRRGIEPEFEEAQRGDRAKSPENLCLKVKLTSQSELAEIREYRLRSADCHLERKDLAPLIADHQETVNLINRVCSPAFLGGPLPDILRFDEYKMPPFPE